MIFNLPNFNNGEFLSKPPIQTHILPRHLVRQFLSFAEVGVIGTLAHYGTLIALVQIATTTPIPRINRWFC